MKQQTPPANRIVTGFSTCTKGKRFRRERTSDNWESSGQKNPQEGKCQGIKKDGVKMKLRNDFFEIIEIPEVFVIMYISMSFLKARHVHEYQVCLC